MAYQLNAGEAVAEGLRRIAAEELGSAAEWLAGARAAEREEAIHEARKSLKKTRAILRLARAEMGAAYGAESRRLRDAGRKLSPCRDAAVLIETFDALRKKYAPELGPRQFASIRRALLERRRRAERSVVVRRSLPRVAAGLQAAAKRSQRWHLPQGNVAILAPALDSAYRRARKAFRKALQRGRVEDYHEWRKRAKDQWYHLRLLQAAWTEESAEYEKSLKELQTWLGDEHNLTLLRDVLRESSAAFGRPEEVTGCLRLSARARKELRAKALAYGGRLYAVKTRQPL